MRKRLLTAIDPHGKQKYSILKYEGTQNASSATRDEHFDRFNI